MTRQITPVQQPAGSVKPSAIGLTDGHILVGNSSGQAADVAMSGGATIGDTGIVVLGSPGVSTKGGVQSLAAVPHSFLTALSTGGALSQAQPATTDLSDISVGTWTPVDASGAGLTFTSVVAGFTRLGNLLFYYGTLTYPTTADVTAALLGGLPIAGVTGGKGLVPAPIDPGSPLVGSPVPLAISVAATQQIILANSVSGAALTNASLSGQLIRFGGFYPLT